MTRKAHRSHPGGTDFRPASDPVDGGKGDSQTQILGRDFRLAASQLGAFTETMAASYGGG